jgi:hypothetical protein
MSEQPIYCPRCGGENQRSYRFCMYCGSALQASVAQAPRHDPLDDVPPPPPSRPGPATPIQEPTAPLAEPPKKRRSGLTCVILAIIAICLCGALAAFAWYYGDPILQMLGVNIYQ